MKPQTKYITKDGSQYCVYPDQYLCITQLANGSYSHQGILAVDVGGKGGLFYAPCDVNVAKNEDPNYHTVIFWTINEVEIAKGIKTHLSFLMKHDNNVVDLVKGKVIPQGERWYQEGGWGPDGAKSYPAHIHLNVAIGHTTRLEKFEYEPKKFHTQLVGSVPIEDVFFVNDTIIQQTLGMTFKTYVEPVETLKIGDKVWIKETATTYSTGQKIPPMYKKGGIYAKTPYIIKADGDKTSRYINKGHWLLSRINSYVKKGEVEKA